MFSLTFQTTACRGPLHLGVDVSAAIVNSSHVMQWTGITVHLRTFFFHTDAAIVIARRIVRSSFDIVILVDPAEWYILMNYVERIRAITHSMLVYLTTHPQVVEHKFHAFFDGTRMIFNGAVRMFA